MYIRVYAPDGEPFDVTRERADRLILQEGWTQTPTSPAPIVEEIPKKDEEEAEPAKPRRIKRTRLKRQ